MEDDEPHMERTTGVIPTLCLILFSFLITFPRGHQVKDSLYPLLREAVFRSSGG